MSYTINLGPSAAVVLLSALALTALAGWIAGRQEFRYESRFAPIVALAVAIISGIVGSAIACFLFEASVLVFVVEIPLSFFAMTYAYRKGNPVADIRK